MAAAIDVSRMQFSEDRKNYIVDKLDPILEELVNQMLDIRPPDPTMHLIMQLRKRSGLPLKWETDSLREKNEQLRMELNSILSFVEEAAASTAAAANDDDDKGSESEESEDDDDDEVPDDWMPANLNMKARASVSAEAYGDWNVQKVFKPPEYPKTEEQQDKLKQTLQKSFLFNKLEDRDMNVVLGAMQEKNFEAGARIITEGDDGDVLFVIESGFPVCKKKIDGEQKVVKECVPGDVVGELALLYNAPRAATVDATDACKTWQLDRETFNYIVKSGASTRATLRDDQLKNVTLFLSLDAEERQQIMQALKSETFTKGDVVIKQDEPGDKFYIVDNGELVARRVVNGEERQRMDYKDGDYFGELALIKNQPRAATVEVTSDTAKLLSVDRKTFNKMLGPLEKLLNREQDYRQ